MDDRSDTIVLCPKCGSPPPSVSGCMADDCPTQEIIDMMCQPPANHPAQNPTTVWRGQCGVCMNWFEHPERTEDNPSPSGTFCPVCRDERRMMAPGVVHWKAEAVNV